MGSGLNGSVYVDIPPMPNVKLAIATAFPTAAPPNVRFGAQGVSDMEGIIGLTHNATNVAAPSFTLCAWSDVVGYWIQYATLQCPQFGQIGWKVFCNTPIFIFSSVALTGGSAGVWVGGITIQGNVPVVTAGV